MLVRSWLNPGAELCAARARLLLRLQLPGGHGLHRHRALVRRTAGARPPADPPALAVAMTGRAHDTSSGPAQTACSSSLSAPMLVAVSSARRAQGPGRSSPRSGNPMHCQAPGRMRRPFRGALLHSMGLPLRHGGPWRRPPVRLVTLRAAMAQHQASVTTQTRSRQAAPGRGTCCAPCPASCLPWHRGAALPALRGPHLGNCAGVSGQHHICQPWSPAPPPPTPARHAWEGPAKRRNAEGYASLPLPGIIWSQGGKRV